MNWLNNIVDELLATHPNGELIVESGIAPSGSYHMGYLRETLMCDAIARELKNRGRDATHLHFVDDMDAFRKVPANLPAEYDSYLGQPLCDMPAPNGSENSYADYLLKDFLESVHALGIEMTVLRSHEKYREGFFTQAIETTLLNVKSVAEVLQKISGRQLDDQWSPIQVNEDGYLKKRPFVSIDTRTKTIQYLDKDEHEQTIEYTNGKVKLDWRLDWPARWWLLGVHVEPFGREHGTKGGSYDTGSVLCKEVFDAPAPLPVPYEFINRAGDTKKMSASKGNGILMSEVVRVLPPEVVRFFVLQAPPSRQLFFDPEAGVVRLIDEFAELLARPDKTEADEQLIRLCVGGIETVTISDIPFSHLAASYQAALRDPTKTLEIIKRTEYAEVAAKQQEIIYRELDYLDKWLDNWAPEAVKFSLNEHVDPDQFDNNEKEFLAQLADKVSAAPNEADGEWFHKAIYDFKSDRLAAPQMFSALYRCLIAKDKGPRAGWFLSILPRDWLIERLKLNK